jgi:hypothetical protein
MQERMKTEALSRPGCGRVNRTRPLKICGGRAGGGAASCNNRYGQAAVKSTAYVKRVLESLNTLLLKTIMLR